LDQLNWKSLIGDLLKKIFTDQFFYIDDGALATFIGFGIALSIFGFTQYQHHFSLLLSSDSVKNLFERPRPVTDLTPYERAVFFNYRNILTLTFFVARLFLPYLIAGSCLLFSWFGDKDDLPVKFHYFLRNSAASLTVITFGVLLVYYMIWLFSRFIEVDFRVYTQIILYRFRRFGFFFSTNPLTLFVWSIIILFSVIMLVWLLLFFK